MARVELEQLSKEFRGRKGASVMAVKRVDLTVDDGELLVLVGPSGCGKTTLLRLVAGFEDPTTGTIRIDGKTMNGISPGKRDVAMVFQSPALYPHMSAYENMAFGLKLRGVANREREARVQETAEWLGLAHCLERRPMELSGGERQRVALGRAIVRRPRVILLDEPLSNLDAPLRTRMRLDLASLQQRLGMTMIYVTHDQTEAMALGSRLVVMRSGAIQQAGSTREVYRQPLNQFVAEFLGTPPMNFLKGRLAVENNVLRFQMQAGGDTNSSGSETLPKPAGEDRPSPEIQGYGPASANATGAVISEAAHGEQKLVLELEPAQAETLRAYAGKAIVFGLRPQDVVAEVVSPMASTAQTGSSTSQTPAHTSNGLHKLAGIVEMVEHHGEETYVHALVVGRLIVARAKAGSELSRGQSVALLLNPERGHWFDAENQQSISVPG